LEYGKGKIVEFDMDMIKTNSVEILLKGKYMINFDDPGSKINFQCINMGNLYSQMEEINK